MNIEDRVKKCEAALLAIASLGGNLPDERLTMASGPNDARHRGLMYCEARRLATAALRIEYVNHRNGNPRDNDLSNLEVKE